MPRLADDWPAQRQTCVDVLCAYLRMPYQPAPGPDAPPDGQQAFRSLREVRHTVIRVITAHLQPDDSRTRTAQDWRGLSLDFTGTVFDGGNFQNAQFTGGIVLFGSAQFTGGEVRFKFAHFGGGMVSFDDAREWSVPLPGIDWRNLPPGVLAPHIGADGTGIDTSGT